MTTRMNADELYSLMVLLRLGTKVRLTAEQAAALLAEIERLQRVEQAARELAGAARPIARIHRLPGTKLDDDKAWQKFEDAIQKYNDVEG